LEGVIFTKIKDSELNMVSLAAYFFLRVNPL